MPFPIMGRTAWFITSLSVADYRTFIDDTAARGYNAIELHVVNHDPRGNNPPFNGNGDAPFLKRLDGATWNGALTYGNINNEAPDFTTPNEAYWSFVDGFLAYCESKGILVFLFPAYVGAAGSDEGWMQEMVANGATKMQSYGAWIATRYKNQKNLVWMMGGDMGTAPNTFNPAQTNVENALLTGLKSVPGAAIRILQRRVEYRVDRHRPDDLRRRDDPQQRLFLDGRREQPRSPRLCPHPVVPAFLLEEPYDEEGPDGNGVNPSATQPVRRFQWWGWLSTIGGYISGNGYVWPFERLVRLWPFRSRDWHDHLDTQGSRDMARLNAFMRSIAWYNLVPSGLNGMRTLITAGGSSVSSKRLRGRRRDSDGTLLVAYIPPAHRGANHRGHERHEWPVASTLVRSDERGLQSALGPGCPTPAHACSPHRATTVLVRAIGSF